MQKILPLLPPALLLLTGAACWWLTVAMATDFALPATQAAWQHAPFPIVLLMWAMMMLAMMLPSFLPTLRCHQQLRQQAPNPSPLPSAAFIAGYFTLWLAFSLAAALLQHIAAGSGMLTLSLAVSSPLLAATLLAAAGAFQFTTLKMRCLHGCRQPAFFFLLYWRSGVRGAWRMGLHNGLLCLGCCAWLMLLLFVFGVMDLTCILLLTLYVLAEKTLPLPPQHTARASGALLLLAALWQLWQPHPAIF